MKQYKSLLLVKSEKTEYLYFFCCRTFCSCRQPFFGI